MLVGESTAHNHAFIVIDSERIVEAWPSGARISALADYAYDYVMYGWRLGLSAGQRDALAQAALSLHGIGYGLVDYLALSVSRMRLPWIGAMRRVASPHHLLPAQFVAAVYHRAQVELMPGEPDVTLAGLGDLWMTSRDWALHVPATHYA
ncbi:hypothetical protein ACFFMN_22995 [Planobispora siamensis]|nr:hypothetical protein [Planobispora siamensis]